MSSRFNETSGRHDTHNSKDYTRLSQQCLSNFRVTQHLKYPKLTENDNKQVK